MLSKAEQPAHEQSALGPDKRFNRWGGGVGRFPPLALRAPARSWHAYFDSVCSMRPVNPKPISQAKDPDLRAAAAALLRARKRAEEIARETGTLLVEWRDGKVVMVPPPKATEQRAAPRTV